jgi:hypothetical protein
MHELGIRSNLQSEVCLISCSLNLGGMGVQEGKREDGV